MTAYDEATIWAALDSALSAAGLTREQFMELGEADELVDIDLDLDFAFRALLPSLRRPSAVG